MKQALVFPRRLNPADAGFFFLGERRDCNVAMVMVGILEEPIPFADVVQELTEAAADVPRFKDFLSRTPLGLAPPVWMPKPRFEVREQIHHIHLEASNWDEVIAVVDRLQAKPVVRDAPPWEVLFLDGLPENRALLAMKVHHALSDGIALSLLFAKAFGGDFLARTGVEVTARSEGPPASPVRRAVSDRLEETGAWLRKATRRLPEVYRQPAARRRELESLRRHLKPRRRPLDGTYSRERRLCGFRVPTDTWNEAGHVRGGSPNDLYLALVARAMRLHFPEWDLASMPLQLVMPVDVREGRAEQDGGNVTGVGVVELPGTAEDLQRLAAVRSRSRAVQEQIGKASPALLDEIVQLLPGRARAAVQFREFATRDAVATNIPMPIPGELCGVPFRMMFMVAPPIGAPVGFSLTSYGDHVYLAANADPAVAGHSVEASVEAALQEVFDSPTESLRGGTMAGDLEPA